MNNSQLYIKCNMLSKSSKWELGFVHFIPKFTISRFIISRFEWYIYYVSTINIFSRLACQFSIIKRRQNNMQFSNSHTAPCFKFKFPALKNKKANPFQYGMPVCYCAMRIMEMILSAVWKLSELHKQFWHCARAHTQTIKKWLAFFQYDCKTWLIWKMHNVMYSEVGSDMSLEIVAITLKKFPQKKSSKLVG